MRIIALSDTHSRPLTPELIEAIKDADLLVHVGDFCEADVYHSLKLMKEVRAVYGNMDGSDLREVLPRQAIFECEGVKIGLAHGEGAPDGIVKRLQENFKGTGVDLVVFGHSHVPYHETIDGVLYFNPGSPTDLVRSPFLSYGVIDVKDGKVRAKIVKLRS